MLRASNVGPVLQQQVLGALEDLFVLGRGLAVFAVADLVDDAAEGGHDMELVKDDLGVGQFFLTALMYGSHISMTTASTAFRCRVVSRLKKRLRVLAFRSLPT